MTSDTLPINVPSQAPRSDHPVIVAPISEKAESISCAATWSGRAGEIVLSVLLVATALMRFWQSPLEASGRLIVPDGVEYAVSAHRFATTGSYDIVVAGTTYPPRYPPFFSVLFLAPVYFVAPGEIGNGIVVIIFFALAAVIGAYLAGRYLAGPLGGALSALAFVHQPLMVNLGRTIMTDLPLAAVFALALVLFLQMAPGERPVRTWLLAGLLIATAMALRPLGVFLVFAFLPILRSERRRIIRLAALLAPAFGIAVLTALYNRAHFGAFSRTGYHFWCPLPFDVPGLTFSWRYLLDNLAILERRTTVLLGLVGLFMVAWRGGVAGRRTAAFVVLAAAPLTCVHLFYLYPDARFHAALLMLFCISGGAGLMLLLPHTGRNRSWLAAIVVAAAIPFAPPPDDRFSSSRHIADTMNRWLPDDAVIVTGVDPVYLDPLVLRSTQRTWVPATRQQEYASKVIAPRQLRLGRQDVQWPGPHRQPALLSAGAVDPVAWTAQERPDLLAGWLEQGRSVYLDTTTIPPGTELQKNLRARFQLDAVDPEGLIMRLSLRRPATRGE